MKKSMTIAACLLVGVGFCWFVQAGDLEPSAPPGSTMVTLQEMFDELKSPAPDMCFDNAGRFVDCGDGTVKDNFTGLFWLKNANCFGITDWAAASIAAVQLADGQCGLPGSLHPGHFR